MQSSEESRHRMGDGCANDCRPFCRLPEDGVVVLAKAGDVSAFAELVHRNYARVRRLACLVARNTAIAEDVVGESFYQAFKNLSQFESTGQFSAWLNRIVINECRETARKHRRVSVEFEERLHSPAGSPENWHTLTPEQQAGQSEFLTVLGVEIRRIPAHLREPFLMRVRDEPISQIAAQLGLTESAVKARVNRARHRLRSRMARHLPKRVLQFGGGT